MKENVRNLTVGITVLIAFALLAGMIVLFTGLPEIFQGGYLIQIHFDNTGGAHTGDPVYLMGIEVGRITEITYVDPEDPNKGVSFVARVKRNMKLPGNVQAYIFTKSLVGGGAYVALVPNGKPRIDPQTGKVEPFLPTSGTIVVPGVMKAGGGLIPDELLDAVKDLGKLATNLNNLITQPPEVAPPTATSQAAPPQPPSLAGTIGKLKNQANIKIALANLAKATASATEAMDAVKGLATEAGKTIHEIHDPATQAVNRMNDLANKLIDSAERISSLVGELNKLAMKLNSNEGTAGKLLNDPALYNNLLDATKQLTDLMKDFRELVKTWNEKGVPLKLK
jgi:phospholipid/cholesterol/gamma-HCH transport system substrate-binding protein